MQTTDRIPPQFGQWLVENKAWVTEQIGKKNPVAASQAGLLINLIDTSTGVVLMHEIEQLCVSVQRLIQDDANLIKVLLDKFQNDVRGYKQKAFVKVESAAPMLEFLIYRSEKYIIDIEFSILKDHRYVSEALERGMKPNGTETYAKSLTI